MVTKDPKLVQTGQSIFDALVAGKTLARARAKHDFAAEAMKEPIARGYRVEELVFIEQEAKPGVPDSALYGLGIAKGKKKSRFTLWIRRVWRAKVKPYKTAGFTDIGEKEAQP